MIQGAIDEVSTVAVVGWIYAPALGNGVSVQAIINQEIIGEAEAKIYRADLDSAGFGSGHCGFEIRFSREIDPLYLPFIEVRLAGSTVALPRVSLFGLGDYVRALWERYPGAGYQASVLGGLWTDRTDAAALLKARVDIGIVAAREAGLLARFLQEGIVVLDRAGRQQAASGLDGDELGYKVAAVLFDDPLLRLLRAILDDHAIAVQGDIIPAPQPNYTQPSAIEDVASPAECLALVAPYGAGPVKIDVLRGSHRFPEFLSEGKSRWMHSAADRVGEVTLGANLLVDQYAVPANSVAVIGPGLLHRICETNDEGALRVLILPARQGELRFLKRAPRGEIAHDSGARVWL
jgi:hypothetical protein